MDYRIQERRQERDTESFSSSASSISASNIESLIDRLKDDRFRGTTKKNYYNIWRYFNQFVIKLDRKPNTWEGKLTLFVGYMIERKRKSSTIKSYISAIRAVLMNIGVELSEDKFLLTSLTRACKIKNDRIHEKIPIQKHLLHLLLDVCEEHFLGDQQSYLNSLYKAIFIAAYYGMLRIGEITTGNHPVKAIDVEVAKNKKKILFILRSSKTHSFSDKPQLIKITSSAANIRKNGYRYCPFQTLQHFILKRPSCRSPENEPFFVFADRSPVKPWHACKILNILIKQVGLEPVNYLFHGFRGGRACDLCGMGVSVETIKKLGRWRSNVVYAYLC